MQRSVCLLFDVLTDVPLHLWQRLPLSDAHHGLTRDRAMVEVHHLHNHRRDCKRDTDAACHTKMLMGSY